MSILQVSSMFTKGLYMVRFFFQKYSYNIHIPIGMLFAQGLMSWRIQFLTQRDYLFIQIAQIFIGCVMRGLLICICVHTFFILPWN